MLKKHSLNTISIIVPALNEERNIQGSLDAATWAAERAFDDYEIIAVDNASTDGTGETIRKKMAANKKIRLISLCETGGLARSYDAGRKAARMAYCAMVHGDDAFDKRTLEKFFSYAGKADVICGYIENPESRSRKRRVASDFYTSFLNFLLGLDLKYYNGLQLHRTEWLKGVEIKSKGFGFQAELLVKALKGGKSFVEVPTRHKERPAGGKSKLFTPLNLLSIVETVCSLYLWSICSKSHRSSALQTRSST